jgi:RNase P/RNase MRP subunit p30
MNERKFYDLNISFGENNKEIIKRAKNLGLSGICLVHKYSESGAFLDYIGEILDLRENSPIDIVSGVMLTGDNIEKKAKELRRKVELILVYGGNYETNRLACESDYVDLLCHPEKGRRDCGIDHVCVREARAHNTLIELNFREILESPAGLRIKKLNLMKEVLRLCLKAKAPFIANSGAMDVWGMRGSRELSALSCSLGAQLYPALVSNSELPERLIGINRGKINQPLSGVYLEGDEL